MALGDGVETSNTSSVATSITSSTVASSSEVVAPVVVVVTMGTTLTRGSGNTVKSDVAIKANQHVTAPQLHHRGAVVVQ